MIGCTDSIQNHIDESPIHKKIKKEKNIFLRTNQIMSCMTFLDVVYLAASIIDPI
jgi:hypothetical protein